MEERRKLFHDMDLLFRSKEIFLEAAQGLLSNLRNIFQTKIIDPEKKKIFNYFVHV